MIVAKKIRFKNLFSVGNAFQEFDLQQDSNLLLMGKSGSGKSTLIDAITFALFGRTYKDLNKGQLVNSINKKNLVVEFEFNNYKIIRGIGPNVFDIYKDNELVEQTGDVRDYQKYLEKEVINMNFKTFTQVVVLGSAAFTPFMKLSAAHRREVIEDLLDLHIFSKMSTLLKTRIDNNKEETATVNLDVQKTKTSLATMKEMLEEQRINSDEEIQKYIERQELLKAKVAEYEAKITTANDTLAGLIKKEEQFPVTIADVEHKKHVLSKKETALNTEINMLNKTLTFIGNNDSCPTCKQNITKDYKDSITSENSALIQELTSKLDKINENIKKINDIYKEMKDVRNNISDVSDVINDFKNDQKSTQYKIESIYESIEALKEKAKKDIPESKLNDLNAELEVHNKKYDALKIEAEDYMVSKKLLQDSGIKSVIIEKYIPLLNQSINKYLEKFDMFVSFELDSEFNETIKSRFRDKFSYNSFSEGQKKRIDFSILLAMRDIAKMKNSVACNLLIIDELMDGLDADNVDNLEEILSEMSNINTIIISHSDDIKNRALFDRSILAKIVGNFTEYEEV